MIHTVLTVVILSALPHKVVRLEPTDYEPIRQQLVQQVAEREGWYDFRATPKQKGDIVIEWHRNADPTFKVGR